MLLTNVYFINEDFSYMRFKFVKGDTIYISSLTTVMIQREKDGVEMKTNFDVSLLSDPIKRDYHDTIRFIFDSKSHLTRMNAPIK